MAHDDYQIYPLTKDALESIVYMHPSDVKMEHIHKLIIRRTLLHNPPISYECFIELITNFIEDLLKIEDRVAIVKLVQNKTFEEIDEGLKGKTLLGLAKGCLIQINTSGIEELYKYGKENVLETIYHEVCHYYQNNVLGRVHGKVQLLELKDEILSHYFKDYYSNNYWQISFECQARYVGKKRLANFINRYNMRFNDNSIYDEMQSEREKMYKTNRVIDGEEVDINEFFDKFIETKPEILLRYPILKESYEVKDGMVIPIDSRTVTRQQ